MPEIRAIETRYAGCRFRSRAEARWAVFFDTLGIPWRYEPEGFSLSSGPYLPDFYLPSLDVFVEVKGQAPNANETLKARDLAQESGKIVYLFVRGPKRIVGGEEDAQQDAEAYFPNGDYDSGYWWCACDRCAATGIAWHGLADRLCKCYEEGERNPQYDAPPIRESYEAATSARFGT